MPATLNLVFIRSRVARRVCLLFVLCAIVPTSGLAVISFTHVANQLYDQSQKRLRQASKALGMAIYERLMFLDEELYAIAAGGAPHSGLSENGSATLLEHSLARRFTTVMQVKQNGGAVRIFGTPNPPPPLSTEQWTHVRSGKGLLLSQSRLDGPPRLLLGKVVPSDPSETVWLAEINNEYLWGGKKEDVLPPRMELCVLDGSWIPLSCTTEKFVLPADQSLRQLEESGAPYFEWGTTERVYLASFWSLPLRHSLLAAPWTVVLSEAKDDSLLPMAGFQYTLTLVMGLSLALVSWLSLRQVQSYLIPLERLQEGTRRIAKQDFASRVRVTSGDEFEELATSFNGMAERLGRQFQMLETMSAISQAILSTYETHEIVKVVQSRTCDALACDAIGVALLESGRAGSARMSTRHFLGHGEILQEDIILTDDDLDALRGSPHHVLVAGHSTPDYLQCLVREGVAVLLTLPILLEETCVGLIVLGYRSPLPPSAEDIGHARQLTDQVSVALANAREIGRRHEADANAYFLAHYDPLTRLANRQLFHDRIVEALRDVKEARARGAVFLIDLDKFQRINDTFGSQTGDRLLGHVADCLCRCVRTVTYDAQEASAKQATIARLGGDQFGILLPNVLCGEEPATVAKRMLAAINTPYHLEDASVTITASMGIGVFPSDGKDANTLLQNADAALSAAKAQGRNTYQFYAESMNIALANRIKLERALRMALERKEFLLYYQPQVDVVSGGIVGVEALIRWRHPERGFISPAEFIPLAEAENLITSIGEWVFAEACSQQQAWCKLGLTSLDIAINVSSVQFQQPDFVTRIRSIINETDADPTRVELELTESVLMNHSGSAIATLNRLKAMGFRLAMDDFGTGYSSLAYLHRFPMDTLKIDRAFVSEICSKPDAAAIAGAIIAMGHALRLHVLAEGVETAEQLAFLRQRGCNTFQGYLVSKPLAVDEITHFLLTHPRPKLAKLA